MTRSNALRGWWKPWTWSTRTWVIAIALSILVSPFVTRWFCLWQIPDVVLPFDFDDVIQAEVPDDQNAFTVYENVLKMLASGRVNPTASRTAPENADPEISRAELLERLLGHDEEALAEYIRAGQMERAAGSSMKTATFWTVLSLHQQLRQLARHYTALGQTLEESGDIEKAWACHRANLDPEGRRVLGQLDAAQLARILQDDSHRFRFARSILPAFTNLDQARLRDNARFAALTVLFAAQEFQRIHGQFPETIEQLVPAQLDEIPFDPMDAQGGPMHYRREADGTAIVWSVGPNGIDDSGTIETKELLDIGYLIKLNRPAADQSVSEE